jgi:DNA (cytosine-5)-methyltransferase 1
MIPNHYSASLSELDLDMIRHVPPGGNWKSIPTTIPSQRLAQIRTSFKAGEGSRSTYYGRLNPDNPSHTVNTYFNRPGNGSFVHYEQDRMISQREAARLQSFPDNFIFAGNRGSVNKQIGNAVPPLLAYQIASVLPYAGVFVDLFCGAGGLSLGFHWRGWHSAMANDIDESFLATYERNFGTSVLRGDIRQADVASKLVREVRKAFRRRSHCKFVLGGPPCQGFSTAGNRRSMDDERNRLFLSYAHILQQLKPDGFLFENVPGILNMQNGEAFVEIRNTLQSGGYSVHAWLLRAESFAIPQRRTRVFLLGTRQKVNLMPPDSVTEFVREQQTLSVLPRVYGTKQALDDLPPLQPGEDGSSLDYVKAPTNPYQSFMRDEMTASQYLSIFTPIAQAV